MTTKPFDAAQFIDNDKTPVHLSKTGTTYPYEAPVRVISTTGRTRGYPVIVEGASGELCRFTANGVQGREQTWYGDDLVFLIPEPPYEPSEQEIVDFVNLASSKYDLSKYGTPQFSTFSELLCYSNVGITVARHALITIHNLKQQCTCRGEQ